MPQMTGMKTLTRHKEKKYSASDKALEQVVESILGYVQKALV